MERPMKRNDLSRSLVAFDQASTIVSVIELGLRTWLVAGLVPVLARQPLKKLGADARALSTLVRRWQGQATKSGRPINRIVVAFEAGRDGFWLARWLQTRGIEAYVIHPTSIPVSREHRRAKTDRLDAGLLMRAVLGWLRGEPKHCSMVAIPTIAQEDARRPNREHQTLVQEQTRVVNRMKATLIRFGIRNFNIKLRKARDHVATLRGPEDELLPPNTIAELLREIALLQLIREQIKAIEKARLEQLKQRAVARYAGLTGAQRKWDQAARKGTGASRECPGTTRHDPVGLALAHATEKHRARAMVSNANDGRQAGSAQNHDRRPSPQAVNRTVALRDDRRDADRRGAASGDMTHSAQNRLQETQATRSA
jgi:hypothetical protein